MIYVYRLIFIISVFVTYNTSKAADISQMNQAANEEQYLTSYSYIRCVDRINVKTIWDIFKTTRNKAGRRITLHPDPIKGLANIHKYYLDISKQVCDKEFKKVESNISNTEGINEATQKSYLKGIQSISKSLTSAFIISYFDRDPPLEPGEVVWLPGDYYMKYKSDTTWVPCEKIPPEDRKTIEIFIDENSFC